MSSNTKIYETLEFAKVQAQVQQYIQTELGKDKVQAMRISADLDQLEEWQLETEQALGILTQRKVMPIPRLNNLAPALRRLKLEASLNALEIAQVGRLLKTIKQLITFFDELAEDDKVYPALSKWVDQCVHLPQIEKLIEQSITEEGNVLSTASTELASIRRQQTQTEEQIRNQLNQLVKSKASQLSDTLVTMRNDVYVLPVKAEYRNQFGGRIHDQSSTGQTLYIEPQAVMVLNQKRSELLVAESKEIERILMEISVELMPHYDSLKHNQLMVSELDFIQA
ncbi:MAG TPA: endonuclease MutS2, partial [Globicatella sulfidifaciens]|nr:endonuclease MutS2 [Globicatella sulfidifaciens]